jgi:hypothetical protein
MLKKSFAERVKEKAKLDPSGKMHEAYDVMQERIQKRQEARSKFQKIASSLHTKVAYSTYQDLKGQHSEKTEQQQPPPNDYIHQRAIKKGLTEIKGSSLVAPYDARTSDRSRVIWQNFPPSQIVQQKAIVITPNIDDLMVDIYFMKGSEMSKETRSKTDIPSGLIIDYSKDYSVFYNSAVAKELQGQLNLTPVEHEDLQLELSRAAEIYRSQKS